MIIKSSFVVTKLIILVKAGLNWPANVRSVLGYVTIMYFEHSEFHQPCYVCLYQQAKDSGSRLTQEKDPTSHQWTGWNRKLEGFPQVIIETDVCL